MADDDQQYGLQAVDHDPFAVDPMAEPAAISLPPDQPKPEASPQTTPAPAGDGWDRWGAVGGAMKLATAVAHPGSFTNLVADKLSNLSMPTREQWQTGEQALGHTAEHLATLPMRIADKLGLLTTPTEPETPGQVSETDIAKEQERAQAERDFGAATATQMVFGGPGGAEEGAAAMGARGALRQPKIADVFPPDRPVPEKPNTQALWQWQENPNHPDMADARYPTGKKQADDTGPYLVDTESLKRTPDAYEKNVNLVRNYPGVKIPAKASTDQVADQFIDHAKNNLLWLWDQVPEADRARSRQWYDGGNKIVKDFAQKYDIPESSAAGVIATLSPQTPWDMNVSLAQRVLDIHKGYGDDFYQSFRGTPRMDAFFNANPTLQKYKPIWDQIKDRSLGEIDESVPFEKDEKGAMKALWTRMYDEAHGDHSYNLVTPEGSFGPQAENNAHWYTLGSIENAINAIGSGGDRDIINQTLGNKHKVREFYNNLLAPNSPRGDVTIDTHAVAAAHLRPLGGTSPEVSHSLDMSTPPGQPDATGSDITGIRGTYPLYADAYRRAAAERGVLPREMQSVTWEALKGLFPSKKSGTIYDNLWRQYAAGTRGIDETRQRVFDKAGGIDRPWWTQYQRDGEPNAPVQNSGNAQELPRSGLPGQGTPSAERGAGSGTPGGVTAPPVRPSPRDLAYEFDFGAGAPYNEQFPGWANLSGDQKATISNAMLDKIADHAKEVTGANEYARLSGLGGWHEFTNPSYKSRLVATPEVAGDFADTMGYLAQQTKIMGYRPDPAGDRLGLALYGDGLGDEKKLAAFWRDVNDKYPDFSSGFSPSRNQRGQPGIEMLFDKNEPGMADRVKSELIPGLQRLADDHAIGKVDSGIFRATEESREHDWQKDPTGGDYTSRLLARHGPDLLKRLELFKRQELEPALQQHIDAAQGTSPGRGGDRGTGIQETQGAPSLPFRAAASPVKLGSGITDEQSAAARAAAVAAAGRPNLIGLPTENITLAGKPFVPGPVGALHDIAEKYMSDAGLPYDPPKTWVPVDKGRATKIAQAFEDMKHAPDDPQVKASYDAMANETVAQFKALKDSGIKFEFIKPGMDDPYAENPRAAAKDVIENKHLWVFPTEGGFGSGSEAATAAMKNNPLLRPSGEKIEGKEVPVNDLFRIVHDVFGHLKDGNGFRASGEENAWRSHSAMYSDAARPAMTSETRGQNSWVNYGPHGDFNRTASGADTKYADQKIGLLPKWAVDEGRGDTHNFEPVDHNPFKGTAPILRSDHDVSDLISSRPVLQIDPMKRAGGGTVSSTQPSLDKPSIWQSVRDRAYSAPKDEFNPDNTGIDIIPGAHLPDEQRGGMKARDIRGSASGGPVPPRGGDIGNVQSTVAPLVQALDQAVPDFDPEALGFRPSTNVEDVRNKPDWQREIESMTRAPLGIPAHDWPGAAINTNFGVLRAHGGRVEAKNIDHAPTEAQKKAGNYAKDHVHIHGMPITIENPKGGTRRGIGHDGKPWEVTMPAHYGYIKQTEGADGDHVDVYVGPHQKSPHVYVVDQVQAETKKFDEHKALIGFGSEAQAINTYKRGFSDGKGANRIGTITGMTVAQFRDWLRHGDHGKPFKHVVGRSDRVKEILHRHGLDKSATLQ